MVEYKCEICSRIFYRKFLYDQHKRRKTSCANKKCGSKTEKKNDHKCKKCKHTYSRRDSLVRHMKTCKGIKTKGNVNNDINKSIKNNVSEKINENNGLVTNGHANKISYKSPNSNNVIINLVIFAKDGTKNISHKDLGDILGSNKNLFESMISNVNFNPNKPEHHNVYYPDLKSGYGVVYEDNKWISKKIDEILNTLLDAKIEDLNEILNDMGDFLNKKSRNKIKKALEEAEHCSTPPGSRKKLMKYIKTILYNDKDMIIKTRKLTKKQEQELLNMDD